MSKQTEAQRLIEGLLGKAKTPWTREEVAAELRRLADIEERFFELRRHGVPHAVYDAVQERIAALEQANKELLEALKKITNHLYGRATFHADKLAVAEACEAIAKHGGEK